MLDSLLIVNPSVSVPAPAPVASPSCWTEQETVWDTQYVDQVTMQCNEVVKVLFVLVLVIKFSN